MKAWLKRRWTWWTPPLALLVAWQAIGWLPLPEGLDDTAATHPSVEWMDQHGRTLRSEPANDGAWRQPLSEQDVPQSVVSCTWAAEDARFPRHPGVDPLAVARAAWQWARHRRIVSGASTITQQRVKLGHPRPRTLRTKVIEAVLALRLEREWDKPRILRSYLSRIDYGNNAEGLAAAARHYFGKAPRDLSWAEAALLAGLPQAPSRLNPRLHPQRAKARQEWILGRCVALGWLDADTARKARAEPIHLAPARRPWAAPHFVEVARARAGSRAAGPVVTTLDLGLQEACEAIVRQRLATLRERHARDAALVVLENTTGEAWAWVGSPDWSRPADGQVDGVLARRSPGSALKPFAYLRAFEDGATAADVVPDVPMRTATDTGVFEPRNYDGRWRGPVSLREALAGSLNIPAVHVLQRIGGPQRMLHVLRDLGMDTVSADARRHGLGVVLGDVEVRLVDLANAYATLARGGRWLPWRVLPNRSPDAREARVVARPDACWLVADILSDPLARAGQFGLHSPLAMPVRMACKTGTSTGFRDNWAFGFNPRFTVGVWAGNFDGSPMADVSGVTGAAPILADVVVELDRRFGPMPWFDEPPGVHRARVEPWTGRTPRLSGIGREEAFLHGTGPARETEQDRDDQGRVLLGSEYAEWLANPDARVAHRASLAATIARPVITSPVNDARYLLDADAAPGSQRLVLRGHGGASWTSPTLGIQRVGDTFEAALVEGTHRIALSGPGGTTETSIHVRRR